MKLFDMSLFALWARRSWRWLLGICAGMALAETGIFYWQMTRGEYDSLEWALGERYIPLTALAAFTALCIALSLLGMDRGAKTSYTLRRLAATERTALFTHALHNALCFLILWGVQLAVLLGLFLLWRRRGPGHWGDQTALLAFYRVPFLRGVLPLTAWHVYLRNVVWCALLGLDTTCGKSALLVLVPMLITVAVYFPQEIGGSPAWSFSLTLFAGFILLLAFAGKREENKEERGAQTNGPGENDAGADGAEA